MEATECTMDGYDDACSVSEGKLVAHEVFATRTRGFGFLASGRCCHMVLRACCSAECGESGIWVRGEGSQLDELGFLLSQNRACGVVADDKVVAVLKGYRSSGNVEQGYKAIDGAHMTVSSSSSDGDGGGGCEVDSFGGCCGYLAHHNSGKLTMVKVTVDGVCKSYELS